MKLIYKLNEITNAEFLRTDHGYFNRPIDHQSTTNDRLKPVLTTGLVNTHIDRSIANPAMNLSVTAVGHVYDHYFQTMMTFPIKAKFHEGFPLEVGMNMCINGPGHMTHMAATPVPYKVKTFKLFRSKSQMI